MNKKKLQKYNLENLFLISKEIKDFKNFIFYGTLLGIVREGKILKNDDDIDILVDIKNKTKVLKKIKNLKLFKINKKVSNKYFIQLIRVIENSKTFVDLYFYINNPNKTYLVEKHNFLSSIKLKTHFLHIPKKMVFPIKEKKGYRDIHFPNKQKILCKFLYGQNWKKPLKKNFDYRMEIINHKPKLIIRSKLGSATRFVKQIFLKEFKKD